MQIDWWTLALQAVNFLVLAWLLQRFLYRPVKDVIRKRKALAEERLAEAAREKKEAEAAKEHFEDAQTKLTQERQDLLKKVHQELEAERGKVLEAARTEAAEIVKTARGAVAKERQAAATEMRKEAAGLATELAAVLLQNTGSEALNGIFLDRLDRQLAALPADERDRMAKDLAADGARLTVVTAAALPPGDEERWRRNLGARLGLQDKIDFAVDPDILGGAELRFPHAVMGFTWADQLRHAEEVMVGNDGAS